MRSVDDQLERVLATAVQPEPVRIAISEALGLICAEEVAATKALPGFPQAAVDGYAVRAVDVGGQRGLRDTQGTRPGEPAPVAAVKSLPVVGEVNAGSTKPLRLQPKQAVRVTTGAPLPTLADAVLPLAWSDRGTRRVVPKQPVYSGDFVRREGDDIRPGDIAVYPGAVLGPAHIGLLAAVGRSKVLVYPRPRLSIISVGHELVDIDREPGLGQVYDVNSYALAAAARDAGAEVHRVGIAAGEPRRLREIVEGQLIRSEIVVISGAVGGAGSEMIQRVLGEYGSFDTTRVAMHPGSVQGFGIIGDKPCFLFTNNPVAALVDFEVFVRPLIRRIVGKSGRRFVKARALNRLESRPGRRGFIRAQLMRDSETSEYLVEGLSGSSGAPAHLLAGMGEANAMIRIPEEVESVRPGDVVDVLFLSQRG